MTTSPESYPTPQQPGQAEQYAESETFTAVVNGKIVEFKDPGEFPFVFEAYSRNRNGLPLEDSIGGVPVYQRYLLVDANGRAIADALDKVCDDEQNRSLIRKAVVRKAVGSVDDHYLGLYYYSRILDKVAEHLSPDLDRRILNDATESRDFSLNPPPEAA